jgi:quercetin dioxygenase-like cupin family protein
VIESEKGTGEVHEGGLRGWVKTTDDDPYYMVELALVPGNEAFPPHIHDIMHEVTYVVEGEVRAQTGDDVSVWPTGTFIKCPPGLPHSTYAHGGPARVIKMYYPGDEARKMYEQLSKVFADGRPDPATVQKYLEGIDIRLAH